MSEKMTQTPVAQNTLSKKDQNTTDVYHESANVYFHPETEELIILSPDVSGAFDKHWGDLLNGVNDVHTASASYSSVVQKYGDALKMPSEVTAEKVFEDKAETLQKILDAKKAALQDKLGDFSPKGYKEVVELIPLITNGRHGRRTGMGSKYIYVKKGYYDDLGNGSRHNISLKAKDKSSASESIYTYDSQGRRTGIDKNKLKAQLTKTPTIQKLKLFNIDKDDIGSIDKTLGEWADSWNIGDHIDVSAGAQFMRFTANAGASGKWDPYKGDVSFKAEASSVLSIAQGTVNATYFLPDRVGWLLAYTPDGSDVPLNMGMLRVYFETELIGFAGASAQIENQLQISRFGANQLIMGSENRKKQLPRFSERRTSGREFKRQMDEGDEGITCSAEVFGGAKVELSLKGGVQWLKPEIATLVQKRESGKVQAAADYIDFVSIGASIDGMAGVGAGATFYCTFLNGKFCFKFAASLCCGVGAKGAFLGDIGYKGLEEFGAWLAYQLYGLDYHFFELVAKDAFDSYSKICVMLLSDMKQEVINSLDKIGTVAFSINEMFKGFQAGMNASTNRNSLADEINKTNSKTLLTYTPEAKGNLLYLLTRHGVWDHFDIHNRGGNIIPDIYHDRKNAVIKILSSIQTQREWTKVMVHRSSDGSSLSDSIPMSESEITLLQESELRTFLQEGMNRDDELDKIKSRVRIEIAWGYALAMNNTYDYKLAQGRNPFYPKMGEFGPLDNNQAMA